MKNLTKNSNVVYKHLRELNIISNLDDCVRCSERDKRKLTLIQDKRELSYIQANHIFAAPEKFQYSVMSLRGRKIKTVPVISLDSRVCDYSPKVYKRILKEIVEQGNGEIDILGILSEECDDLFSMIVDELSDEADTILSQSFFQIVNFPSDFITFVFTDDIFKFRIYYPIEHKEDQIVTRFDVHNEERDYFSSKYDKNNFKEIVHHICSVLDNQFSYGNNI